MDAFAGVTVVRVSAAGRERVQDRAAAEEPLELRLHGRPFAVIMRTPGADRELAAGFLFAERVVHGADELGTIAHCRDTSAAGAGRLAGNVVDVTLAGGAVERLDDLLAARRHVVANSSCGVCGRLTIASLRSEAAPLASGMQLTAAFVRALPERLRRVQPLFEATGGLHAAGLFGVDGHVTATAEDVGRHNAVDKVIGGLLMRDALPASDHVLFVSGRSSFEIVQKAWFAGIPVVASVSAPSSLAVDLATEAGITLIGFVRGEGFNIYAHADRIV